MLKHFVCDRRPRAVRRTVSPSNAVSPSSARRRTVSKARRDHRAPKLTTPKRRRANPFVHPQAQEPPSSCCRAAKATPFPKAGPRQIALQVVRCRCAHHPTVSRLRADAQAASRAQHRRRIEAHYPGTACAPNSGGCGGMPAPGGRNSKSRTAPIPASSSRSTALSYIDGYRVVGRNQPRR